MRRKRVTRKLSATCRIGTIGWLLASCCYSASAAPSVTRIGPLAVMPGQAIELTCYGGELAGVKHVWTSFPARVDVLPNAEGVDANAQVSLRFTLPNDAPALLGGIRLITPSGVSPLRLLLVDDLRSVQDEGNNHQIESPQQVSAPAAVDGQCDALVADYYAVNATAGQALSVDIFAQRIGSQLDPVVRLLTSAGVELAHNDDSPGCAADCRLRHEFAEDGQYILELRDVRHQGGEQHFYRLRLGDFPLATVGYPMGGQAGTVATFQATGPATSEIAALHRLMPSEVNRLVSLGMRHAEGQGSGFVNVVASDLPEFLESDANDGLDTATRVTLPCAMNGRFEQPDDKDYFRFEGREGERWMFRGSTRSLGSPADLYMELLSADGNRLVSVDDVGKDEGYFEFTFSENAEYLLRVEDLHRSGSPSHVYRIAVKPFSDWFSLSVDKETHTVPHGGTISVKVTSQRRGFAEPIELTVEGASDDVQLSGNTIAKDQNEAQLLITFPPQIEPGTFQMIQVVGRAKVNEQEYSSPAETITALRTTIPQTPYLPASLSRKLAVGVGPEYPQFFTLSLADPSAFFPVGLGTSKFKVLVNRTVEAFTAPIEIGIHDLPEGYAAKVEPVEEGKTEYLVTLTGPKDTIEAGAKHPIRITGKGTHENQTKEVALADAHLEIVPPLVVRLVPQGNVPPGGQQKMLVKVFRFEEEKHPVVVRWKEGPPWLLTPVEITIPADQDQLEVVLASVGETAAGTEGNLIAVATSQVAGQPLSVESPPTALRVEAPPAE